MKFTYSSGQRPLDGYTLKRGIGRGGFGEVYYGVSDGGKEVALKVLEPGNSEVELRGVAQCLNIKHPNLVNLYDVKTDAEGNHWVIMEYVAGESLSIVLNRHPKGMPPELAQQWFSQLAQATNYLHEHGIVHRDLKPGNIFIENGAVKVGDYGLSKFISCSRRSAQTQSVGTVHYMAPEISTGNYNKQIDIYAGGIILYEMLTGHVPFDGESAGEILMKHLTSPPDLSKLPTGYVQILAKALCKNPAHRYATMAEMNRAVEAVDVPARAVPVEKIPARPISSIPVAKAVPQPTRKEPLLTALPALTMRGRVAELSGSLALTASFGGLATALWAALGGLREATEIGPLFFLTLAVSWAILLPAKIWTEKRGDSWARRLLMMVMGVGIGAGALWLDGWSARWPFEPASTDPGSASLFGDILPAGAGQMSYFALAFFGLRWWKMTDRRRSQRFSLGPLLAAGFVGGVLLLVWPQPWRGLVVLVTSAAIVQLVSPWDAPVPQAARRLRLKYA
jgi:predicted Ser/Thr protein kinase